MRRLFGGVRAPSTLGTYLRKFTHGHVQQLDAVSSRLLAGLAARAPGLLAGAGAGGIAFIDVDDSIREVHGHAKQAAAYGYTGVRGLNFQVAALSTPITAPVIAAARLRKGNIASPKGSGRLLTQAVTTGRRAGVAGQIMARADSAHFCHSFVSAALRAKIWFSVTARMNKQVRASIAAIPDRAWTAIKYPAARRSMRGIPSAGSPIWPGQGMASILPRSRQCRGTYSRIGRMTCPFHTLLSDSQHRHLDPPYRIPRDWSGGSLPCWRPS